MINATKLHQELVEAGIPIDGVVATEPPRIDFRPEVTEAQQAVALAILAAHVPEDYQDKREAAYVAQGVTVEAMIAALWERVVEDRPEASESLQAIRENIKKQFPENST
jgi:hypothetical protein